MLWFSPSVKSGSWYGEMLDCLSSGMDSLLLLVVFVVPVLLYYAQTVNLVYCGVGACNILNRLRQDNLNTEGQRSWKQLSVLYVALMLRIKNSKECCHLPLSPWKDHGWQITEKYLQGFWQWYPSATLLREKTFCKLCRCSLWSFGTVKGWTQLEKVRHDWQQRWWDSTLIRFGPERLLFPNMKSMLLALRICELN